MFWCFHDAEIMVAWLWPRSMSPKDIEFRDELPKSNIGKILRRELRKEEEQKVLTDKKSKMVIK